MHVPTGATPDPVRFGSLIATVANWQMLQQTRIKIQLPLKATQRKGGDAPLWMADILRKLAVEERVATRMIVDEWRTHPLAPWAKTVRGVGEPSAAIIVALLRGNPYVAYPQHWHGSRFSAVLLADEPYTRTLEQLNAYCGYGSPERRRMEEMDQAALLALGKPVLKARLRLLAWSMVRLGNRSLYDEARELYAARLHERPCRGRGSCGRDAGTLWRRGHQHAAALRLVAKQFLADFYDEAKRLHLEGLWGV